LESDPPATPFTANPVWVGVSYPEDALTFTGQVNIQHPSGAISDRLRWINGVGGTQTDCNPPQAGGTNPPSGTLMILYSADDIGRTIPPVNGQMYGTK
jgi:hypothetical protein